MVARPPVKGEDEDDGSERSQLQSPRGATITSTSSSVTTRRKSATFTKRNCFLLILGLLVIGPIFVSISIGNGQYAHEIVSTMIHSRLQDFASDVIRIDESIGKQNHPQIPIKSTYDERTVFESIIKRVKWTKEQCNKTLVNERNTLKEFQAATDLPMLQEGGVAYALERWLEENPISSSTNAYSTCYLPPLKSCHTTTYTLIIMSHTTERLTVFMDPLESMIDTWPGLTEIIIVWNSSRETLTNAIIIKNDHKNDKESKYATQLLKWDQDPSHPLRIFFSLEEGLTNNLLNRYHPKLEPINDAIMYFDDDGPFWSKEAMVYGGFELWKRNSDVQVGGFPRNVRYLSSRMKELQTTNLQQSIEIISRDRYDYVDEIHPTFTPICRNVTGDHVEYNYFTFPDFAGHILLPSGTFLHRNYLCFIWHPAFDELREWVISHKTMPDDMTVSTLVSHLSGKAPRTFPREVKDVARRRLLFTETSMSISLDNNVNNELLKQLHPPDASHRRLLWKQKGWGNMRLEAINSIVGYFGSIHSGTVGWCGGTSYMKHNARGVPFVCHPEAPTLELIPWLTEGGIGSNQCPFEANIKMSPSDFCGECNIVKLGNTCRNRMQYMIQKYSLAPEEAKDAVIKEDNSCWRREKTRDDNV